MKLPWIFLAGYLIVIGGILAALWKAGVLARIGAVWTLIALVIAIGIGVLGMARAGSEIRIDKS